jgi:Fur family iron response transcriptional regulator
MVAIRPENLKDAVMVDGASIARELLADTGLRVTRQRAALTSLQAGAPGSISSVYRALKDFSEAGLLRKVPIYGSTAYFDTQLDHHHHVYAEDEDRLMDLPVEQVSIADLPPPPEGYELVSIDVLMRVRRKTPVNDAA